VRPTVPHVRALTKARDVAGKEKRKGEVTVGRWEMEVEGRFLCLPWRLASTTFTRTHSDLVMCGSHFLEFKILIICK